jgi:hypothetical protein
MQNYKKSLKKVAVFFVCGLQIRASRVTTIKKAKIFCTGLKYFPLSFVLINRKNNHLISKNNEQ